MTVGSWKMIAVSLIAATMTAGCAAGWNVQALQDSPRVGHRHNVALMNEYQDLALFEADRGDWNDADYFALKGLAAGRGEQVLPDEVGTRDVPMAVFQELADARAQLVGILYSGGRDFQPELIARCQALYDCWIAEQEEDDEDARIMVCRDGYYECIMAAGARPPPDPNAPPTVGPGTSTPGTGPQVAGTPDQNFVILFGFDSAALTSAGRAVIEQAIVTAQSDPTLPISLVGYTDTAGPSDYNLRLSRDRARTVREYMITRGIAADRISVDAVGESQPAVPTGDNVRNQTNRRVVITVS